MKAPLLLVLVLVPALAASVAAQQPRRTPPPADPDRPDCAAMGALPEAWSGQAYAVEGDTLAGVGLKPQIRLWGIQAPELRDPAKRDTAPGMRARAALEDLLGKSDHKLKCRIAKLDRECRAVAQCSLDAGANSIDVGGAMIASGMAYGSGLSDVLAWEPKASQRYADAELEARKARRGLWPEWLGEK
jgi:endonuclease YncB( thermonuclease family)